METFRNYKLRLYPTPKQVYHLEEVLEDQRQLYIAALAERIDCYQKTGKGLTMYDQGKSLTICRRDIPEMAETRHVLQEGTLRRLDRAYQAFFRRAKSGDAPGFPRFPGKDFWCSFEYRYRPRQRPLDLDGKRLQVPGVGGIKFRHSGGLPISEFTATQAVIERDRLGRWFATVGVKYERPPPVDDSRVTGVDLNTKGNMIVAYDGEGVRHCPLPDLTEVEAKYHTLQRALARKPKGSKAARDMKVRIAKVRARGAAAVKYAQHVYTTELARGAYTIGTEKLKVRNMTRSAKGTLEKPGTNVAAKSGLNRVFLEAAPARTLQMLSYKAGRHVEVNPKNTSRKCSQCGFTAKANRSRTSFVCGECGYRAHADENAARNVRQVAVMHTVENARELVTASANRPQIAESLQGDLLEFTEA